MVFGGFVLTESLLRYPDLQLDLRHLNAQAKGCCKCYLRRNSPSARSPRPLTCVVCSLLNARRTPPSGVKKETRAPYPAVM